MKSVAELVSNKEHVTDKTVCKEKTGKTSNYENSVMGLIKRTKKKLKGIVM